MPLVTTMTFEEKEKLMFYMLIEPPAYFLYIEQIASQRVIS